MADQTQPRHGVKLKSRDELEALCLAALRKIPGYERVESVQVQETRTGSGTNWHVAEIRPRPDAYSIRVGEAELTIAPLQARYRLEDRL